LGLLSPFAQDEALENGQRRLTISSAPYQYRAKDGKWSAIDPRFTETEEGFTNFTNALHLSVGRRFATLNLRNENTLVQWESRELALTQAGYPQTMLATALSEDAAQPGTLADNGQMVRFTHSWSLPELVEEVAALPGAAEQRLIVTRPLAEMEHLNADAAIELIASLRISPSATLFANGISQTGSFSTDDEVEIRDAAGKTALILAPVIAFEQNRPENQVAGAYEFTPTGAGEWRVAVKTPGAWWASPERAYPVVIDPTMKMLAPITTAQLCEYYTSSPCPLTGSVDPSNGVDILYIGRSYMYGITRALIRFDDLPTLPAGYVVDTADLLIAPKNFLVGSTMVMKQIRVRQVTSAWKPSTVYSQNNDPTIADLDLDQKNVLWGVKPAIPVSAESFVTRFHLQSEPGGLVSGWLSGAIPNYGLILDEPGLSNCTACGDFTHIYAAPLWTKNDVRNLDPGKPFPLSASEGSGIMLQITYSPPTLVLGEPVITNLPTFGEIYADSYHAYLPPSSNSTWTAVAVKGLNEVQSGDTVIDKAAGNLRLARGCTDPFSASCAVKTSEGDFTKRPNFILTRGNPANTDLEAWLYPPNPQSPANATLDSYMISAVPSVNLAGNPTLSPGAHITQTVIMSTSEIMQLHNLSLQANSRLGVRVRATSIDPASSFPMDMPYIDARLYPPTTSGKTFVKDVDGQYIGGHNAPGSYEFGKIKVGASQGGTWALALEYFGDVDPAIGEPPITYTYPMTMSLELIFVSCASDGIPTQNGCLTVSKPTFSTAYMDVGNFRVFNEAGFSCNGTLCSTVLQTGPGATTPSIVWKADWVGGQQDRWVAIAPGSASSIVFDTATMYFMTNGNTWLASDTGAGVEMLELFTGVAPGYPGVNNPSDPTYARIIPLAPAIYASPPLTLSDVANLQINVNVDRQAAEAGTILTRQVKTSPVGLEDFSFSFSWDVQAEGYSTLANQILTPISLPPDAEIASLTLLFGTSWDVDYSSVYQPNGRFTNLRNFPGSFGDGGIGAKVAAPTTLGSNWKGVTALLLPVGENLPDSDSGCAGDCLDIRSASDTPSAPNRTWDLPDLVINGQAQTIFFNKPGELNVFSTDHPNAAEAVSVPFSFRTFEGDVTVDVKVCPNSGSAEKVVVITGQSKMALPGLGSDTNPTTMIGAEFILCETTLREVSMQFQGPPDIPVGSTGILVNYVKGDVLLGPTNTQITFDLEYHDNSNIVDGEGTVTINTAGLFELQTSGEVLAKVDYNGHAWVGWNPLDVGVDVSAWYSSWLKGNVKAHLWKGQGWQNKYSWLPNDNATHFAGSIAASIQIDTGQAFSWAFIEIPPWDMTFEITVAFGQFCKSSGCSKYEWGFKGKFDVIGYGVGFFYGFDSGFGFILGSDGHVLIDQYASSQSLLDGGGEASPTSAGKLLALARQAAPDPLAATAAYPLSVTPFTGSFMAGLTWSQGAPALTLIRPDSVEITPGNAASYGITVVSGSASTLYGVPHPMQGTWQAKISNTAAGNDYHFAWFANKAIPEVDLQTPAGNVSIPDNSGQYNLQWSVPPTPPGLDLRISLYYTVTNSTALTETQNLGGMIRENLPLSSGNYNWDLSSLAFGDYQVYARVYSGQPGNEPIEPSPTLTGTNQIPGEAWVTAPGVIHLQDYAAPSTPTGLGMVPITDGFWACWAQNSEKDLSGYVLRYFSPDVFGDYHQHDLRLHAEVADPNTWQQCARLGGFNSGENIMTQIAAYDASGNLSEFSNLDEAVAEGGVPSTSPDPGELSVVHVATDQVELSWGPVELPPGGGVWLYYSPGLPLGNGRLDSPWDLGEVDSFTLRQLTPGFVWFFGVQTHDDWSRLSHLSVGQPVLVSDFVDADGDGLPDDWEAAYEVSEPDLDEDGDGLSNIDELSYGTHPHYPDTDGDGFSDGSEIVGGSDLLDPNFTPAVYEYYTSGLLPLPDLSVDPTALFFHAYTQGSNPAGQTVIILNQGGGTLSPVISDNAAWLSTSLDGENLSVSVNKSNLATGHYQGLITIQGALGSYTQNSPQAILVDLWLLSGVAPDKARVYLPVVQK